MIALEEHTQRSPDWECLLDSPVSAHPVKGREAIHWNMVANLCLMEGETNNMNNCSHDKWHIGTICSFKRAYNGDRRLHLFMMTHATLCMDWEDMLSEISQTQQDKYMIPLI